MYKMFSLFNSIRTVFFGGQEVNDLDEEYKKAIKNLQTPAPRENINKLDGQENTLKEFCSHRVGTVTTLDTDFGFIDEKYYFDICVIKVPGVQLNSRVAYILYKLEDLKNAEVSKIYQVMDDSWESTEINTDSLKSTIESNSQILKRNIVTQVVNRQNREITLFPSNITVDLNKIQTEFIPRIGDWITLTAFTEVDESSTDLTGEILCPLHIYPLRSKRMTGTVKDWNLEVLEGIIDSYIYFDKESCEPGYLPCIGDRVVCEIIESYQKNLTWRALTIVPIVDNDENINSNESSNIHTIDMLIKNKNGIEISDELKFNNLYLGDKALLKVILKNVSSEHHKLLRCRFHCKKIASQLTLKSHSLNEELSLKPDQSIEFQFQCTAKFIGNTRELFVFSFKGFKIGRWFEIAVTNGCSILRNEKYIRQNHIKMARKMNEHRNAEIYQGTRLIKPPAFVPIKMGLFSVPNCLWDAVIGNENCSQTLEATEILVEKVKPCLKFDLSVEYYSERFETLLYFEEIQMHVNMRAYDMESCQFTINGEYLMLEVQNLYERRPSLMIGDRVLAYNDLRLRNAKYEGYIHKIHAKHIYLKFNNSFHNMYDGQEYNVQFLFMRTTLRRCHQAVRLAVKHLGKEFLFPTKVVEKYEQVSFYLEDDFDNLKSNCLKDTKEVCSKNTDLLSDCDLKSNFDLNVNNNKFYKNVFLEENLGKKNLSCKEVISREKINFHNPFLNSQNNKKEVVEKYRLIRQNQQSKCNFSDGVFNRNDQSNGSVLNYKDSNNLLSGDNQLSGNKTKLYWLNKNLNCHQKEAVKNILKGVARPLPYIIFGPPGTGKTVTLVETVLQILRMIPGSRLLVTSPSNSSADLLALRILDSGVLRPGDLVRLVAHRCITEGTIPEKLIPYCATGELAREGTRREQNQTLEGARLGCTTTVLGRHRITVATCVSLGQLYNMGLPPNHFTHVLIDEAGQATEPEVLIPLSLLNIETGQVVLAGDPLQLGPVVMSRLAERYGMSESFLERLIRRFPYIRDSRGFPNTGGYDPRLITRLAINYRSVPEILNLPSALFYDTELQAVVSQEVGPEADILAKLAQELPSRNNRTPPAIVFHGVRGENLQQTDCPSWYNPHEATQVYFYVNKFYNLGLTASDIGIITPYSKQVQQIRALLSAKEFDLPKVGSVEEFQGQERNVIILSSVRSTTSLCVPELRNTLGFIASPRRFNVALTRAKALIIIIGNPHVLAHDPYWRSALQYCIKNNAYVGCDLPTLYMNVDELNNY